MLISFAAIQQWIALGEFLIKKGSDAWNSVREAAKAAGYDGDTSELDKVIADADRRKGIARGEAGG